MTDQKPHDGAKEHPTFTIRNKENMRAELARRAGATTKSAQLFSCAKPKLLRMHLPCDKEGTRDTFVRGEEIQVHHRESDPDHPNYYKGVILDFVLECNVLVLVTKETIKYEGERTLNLGIHRQPLDEAESRKLWYITKVKPPPEQRAA